MTKYVLLIINPGSTSTKVALYEGSECYRQENLSHSAEDLALYPEVVAQYPFRLQKVEEFLASVLADLGGEARLDAVAGIGGLLRPLQGGTYVVNEALILDLQQGVQGQHASNLGGLLAAGIASRFGVGAYIVDPVAVDEFEDVSRLSGHPLIVRRSLSHALNIKAVARRVCHEHGQSLALCNFVVAHLGGGISVAALRGGRIIDVNNANEMGPFSPERTGSLPAGDLARLCFSGKFTAAEMKKQIAGQGGMVAYLATNDVREAYRRADQGDAFAKLVISAMTYQIGKEIGSMAAALQGRVDAVILTGGLANSQRFVQEIAQYVDFIAPLRVCPGEDEMLALAEGVCRVLDGDEEANIY
ncbi:MAG: butyrate kinase [Firmicutes bacterium]|nr:butyrate kinase [Bacillota bacterium]